MSQQKYNMSHSAIKRIMSEIQELKKNPSSDYIAYPLDDNLFEWHFSVRGPSGTAFEGGIYHGRIILPSEYPYKPPDIMLLTPNGRFETHKKICLSISSHHPESWMPAWGIRSVLIALIGFFPTPAQGIGAIEYPDHMRKEMATKSVDYKCSVCGCDHRTALPTPAQEEGVVVVQSEDQSEQIVSHTTSETTTITPRDETVTATADSTTMTANENLQYDEHETQHERSSLAQINDSGQVTAAIVHHSTPAISEHHTNNNNAGVEQDTETGAVAHSVRKVPSVRVPPNQRVNLSFANGSSSGGVGAIILNVVIFLIAAIIGYIMYIKTVRGITRGL